MSEVLSNVSRRSKTNSTSAEIGVSEASEGDRPTPQERYEEFCELYSEKADLPLVHEDPEDPRERSIKLREEVAEEYGGEYYPLTWGGAVLEFLEWYERCRGTGGRFEDGEGEEFTIPLENSYMPSYGDTYYAKLMGLQREVEREYDDPHTALLSLTASTTYEDGSLRAPVDHRLTRRDAWGPVYRKLKRELDNHSEIDDWCYVVIEEHHPGPFKDATGYGHDHPAIFADGEISESDFFDVIDKHVEACEPAEFDAHDYRHPDEEKRPIKVRRLDSDEDEDPEVMNAAGGYLGKYIGAYGEDLLERDIEEIAFLACKWATNTQRIRFSDRAGEAHTADRCRQKYRDEREDQEHDHGERLAHRESGRGQEIVCKECGSGWGIDEDADTVTEVRAGEVVGHADRHLVEYGEENGDSVEFRAEWPDARAGARVTDEGKESFERVPGVRWIGIVVPDDGAEDGERVIETEGGGGVEMVTVRGWRGWPVQLEGPALEGNTEPGKVSGGAVKQTLRRDRPPD